MAAVSFTQQEVFAAQVAKEKAAAEWALRQVCGGSFVSVFEHDLISPQSPW